MRADMRNLHPCLHSLCSTEQGTSQDTEKATRTGGIYELEPAEGGKSQDMERSD
jgi:hypothetical protein